MMTPSMNDYLLHTAIALICRYFHIVSATLLVGGTLFYEMVVPIAINDLKPEAQLIVFARARWVFKGIVWLACLAIVPTGIYTTFVHWNEYARPEVRRIEYPQPPIAVPQSISPAGQPGWWFAAHASTGLIAVLIALSLTIGKAPPEQPIRWMRLNLVILLLVIFFASATRQTRLQIQARALATEPPEYVRP